MWTTVEINSKRAGKLVKEAGFTLTWLKQKADIELSPRLLMTYIYGRILIILETQYEQELEGYILPSDEITLSRSRKKPEPRVFREPKPVVEFKPSKKPEEVESPIAPMPDKLRDRLSPRELEMFEIIGEGLNFLDSYWSPIALYHYVAERCFLTNKSGPAVYSLRNCLLLILNDIKVRATPEFESLIILPDPLPYWDFEEEISRIF
jgi:hypothetical protein